MSRAALLSWAVVLVVAVVAALIIARVFSVFGSDVLQAGVGAGLWLGLSGIALTGALCALWDLVYLLATGRHLILKPPIALPKQPWLLYLPVLTIALGVLAGYTVFR